MAIALSLVAIYAACSKLPWRGGTDEKSTQTDHIRRGTQGMLSITLQI